VRLTLLLLAIAACGKKPIEAAPSDKPAAKLDGMFCVTKGTASIGATITEPTVRAVSLGSSGDSASLEFTYRGDTATTRELASGKTRRQLGLKLRAMNGCNLVYVMWRLDPRPMLDISFKLNPGARTHQDCGADGYTKLKPTTSTPVPVLARGDTHTLRAEITGDELLAYIDDALVWKGTLPDSVRTLSGPAGLRSDNLAFELVAFAAAAGDTNQPLPKCTAEDGD